MSNITTIIDGNKISITPELIAKYDLPLPRYTSYPTAPNWIDCNEEMYKAALKDFANKQTSKPAPLSLYVHLPFCEHKCTFCACNVVATTKRKVIEPYLDTLEQELELLHHELGAQMPLAQLHWGGGTPTYLDAAQMERLLKMIQVHFPFAPDAEISIEADPRFTDAEKISALRQIGFNRISFGVQDVVHEVQVAADRVQSIELIQSCIDAARAENFAGINLDLIYGLPLQTAKSWQNTLDAVIEFDPDRIALFSFAFVPWLQPQMKKINPADLPQPEAKITFFAEAIQRFSQVGYEFIGLDHFAKKSDELAKAHRQQSLHRNFQGYSTNAGLDLIGLGLTSIGYINGNFIQNEKKLAVYQREIASGHLTARKGVHLTAKDHMCRDTISRIFCRQFIDKQEFAQTWQQKFEDAFAASLPRLRELQADGLLEEDEKSLRVTSLGRFFIRNIGACFDAYLGDGVGKFSRAV